LPVDGYRFILVLAVMSVARSGVITPVKEIEHDVVRKPLYIFRHHALVR
jgi:hypothetical protein